MRDDRQTILLAENTADLAANIARALGVAAYREVRAANGRAALERYTASTSDLVPREWKRSGLGGSGIDELRATRATAATPILMPAARGDEADRVIGLELGADDYLARPFARRALLARGLALVRRDDALRQALAADRGPAQHGLLSHGPLALDPEDHLPARDGTPVAVMTPEFDLLALLFRHPGRVFSRAYRQDVAWGQDEASSDRAVANTVCRLWRKLGGAGDEIEAIWDVGYRHRGRGQSA